MQIGLTQELIKFTNIRYFKSNTFSRILIYLFFFSITIGGINVLTDILFFIIFIFVLKNRMLLQTFS